MSDIASTINKGIPSPAREEIAGLLAKRSRMPLVEAAKVLLAKRLLLRDVLILEAIKELPGCHIGDILDRTRFSRNPTKNSICRLIDRNFVRDDTDACSPQQPRELYCTSFGEHFLRTPL
jgi:hypothetical protein